MGRRPPKRSLRGIVFGGMNPARARRIGEISLDARLRAIRLEGRIDVLSATARERKLSMEPGKMGITLRKLGLMRTEALEIIEARLILLGTPMEEIVTHVNKEINFYDETSPH